MTSLTDRVALVTGGRRIGSAVALALAARGADIALCYRKSRDEAEAAAESIRQLGRRAAVMPADLSDPAACRSLVADTVTSLGRLDILVNMASVYLHKGFDDLTDEDFEQGLAVDLRAAFACSHAASPHLRASGRGRIINFSDWVDASRRPRYTGYLPYYVAKMGVIGLTEALALELAADGVLVNAIAPGPILAPPGTTDEEHQAVVRATPLGRWGGAEEIVKAVLFLVDTDFVTGETIRVDGGRHVR
jgi:NAD(P)-dependent dehydrogenase (short-subunit alcohol dehydrogenase family)